MALTAQDQNDLMYLIVGAFDAAPGRTIFNELAESILNGATLQDIADALVAHPLFSDNTIGEYPISQTNAQFANEYASSLLGARGVWVEGSAWDEAVAVMTAELNAGLSRADLILLAVGYLGGSSVAAPYQAAADALANKVEVALYQAVTLELDTDGSTLDDYRVLLQDIDNTQQSVDDAIAGLEGIAQEGDTLSLTPDVDVLTGTLLNDTFIASNDGTLDQTWSVGDNLNGDAGYDTLAITNDNDSLVLNARTLTSIEELLVINGDDDFDYLNIANKPFEQVTVDYDGTEHGDYLYVEGIAANTDLTIMNLVNDGYNIYRNDSGVYSLLSGTVNQTNSFMNIDFATNDYDVDFYNEAYFFNATMFNLTTNLSNFIVGKDSSSGADEAGYFYNEIELGTDNATVNIVWNLTNLQFSEDTTDIEDYVYTGNSSVSKADTINVTYNLNNVDGIDAEIDYSGYDGKNDSATINANGVKNTYDDNEFDLDYIENITINVTADSDLGDIDAYSHDNDSKVVINAGADLTIDTLDLADSGKVDITITGAGDVTFDLNGDNEGVNVNAAAASGDLTLGVGTGGSSDEVLKVVSGSGDDSIESFDGLYLDGANKVIQTTYDGGAGTDTFVIDATTSQTSEANLAVAKFTPEDAVTNFEILSLTSFDADVVDATDWGLGDNVIIDGYTTGGSLTVNDGATVTITDDESASTDIEIIVDGAGDKGSDSDSLTLVISAVNGDTLPDVTVNDVETINLVSNNVDANKSGNDVNTMWLIAADTETLNISGNATLDLYSSGAATTDLSSVETVNAAGFNAGLTISLQSAGQGVSISVGNGKDTILSSSYGDTIDLGEGINKANIDTIVYDNVAQSQGLVVDTIEGFQSGVISSDDINKNGKLDDKLYDILDFSALTVGTGDYLGEASGYGTVLTALSGSGNTEAVLDKSTSTLYVDINGDGVLDGSDMAIDLTGVTDLDDLNFAW